MSRKISLLVWLTWLATAVVSTALTGLAQNTAAANLDGITSSPDMLLLDPSALNTTFSTIADACIFAPEGKDWGAAYPDRSGQCYLELEKARAYVGTSNSSKLTEDVRTIINSVFESDKVTANSDFRLFVPGYLELFYEDGGEGDWCSNTSFSLRKENRPLLGLDLRAEVNSIVREANSAVETAVATSNHPDRAYFVDLDSQIPDQRFCQPGHTLYNQFYGGKVIFWNSAPEGVIFRSEPTDSGNVADGTYQVREPTPDELNHWLETGAFTTDAREIRTNMSTVSIVSMAFDEGHTVNDKTQWLNQIGPDRNLPGLAFRTLQPNTAGNRAIATAISREIQYQYARASPGADTYQTGSIQILLREWNGYFSWFMYHGPYGFAVVPCGDKKFTLVKENVRDDRKGLSLVDPPFVGPGQIWNVDIPGWWDCRFESPKDGPGFLKCTDALIYDFQRTFREGKIMRCTSRLDEWPNGSYHHAWVVE